MCYMVDNFTSCDSSLLLSAFFTVQTWELRKSIVNYAQAVFGQNVMSKGTARQWCRMLESGRTHGNDEERSVRPAILSEWWWFCSKCWINVCEARLFKMSKLSCEFPQMLNTILYPIITVWLEYYKFCARCVPKVITGAQNRIAYLRLWSFRAIPERWRWYSQ
jgi:hypothetical protein